MEGSNDEEIPQNMLDAKKFFEKYENVESLLRDKIDRSRNSFTAKDLTKCIDFMCDRFQTRFISIDKNGILILENNETTHNLCISLSCYREESLNAINEIIDKMGNTNDENEGIRKIYKNDDL